MRILHTLLVALGLFLSLYGYAYDYVQHYKIMHCQLIMPDSADCANPEYFEELFLYEDTCRQLLLDSLSHRIAQTQDPISYGMRAVLHYLDYHFTASRHDFLKAEQLSANGELPICFHKWAYQAFRDEDPLRALKYVNSYLGRTGGWVWDGDFQKFDRIMVYLDRSLIHYNLQDYTEAIADCDSILLVEPDSLAGKFVLKQLGLSYEKLGNYDQAIEAYSRRLSGRPDDYMLVDIAHCYLLKQDTMRAYQMLNEQLAQLDEDDFGIRSDIWFLLGQTTLAKKALANYIRVAVYKEDSSVDEYSYYGWACDYAKLGDKNKALKYLRKAVSMGDFSAYCLETEDDFTCIRTSPQYLRIVRRLAQKEAE